MATTNALGTLPRVFNTAMSYVVSGITPLFETKHVQEISTKVNNFVLQNETAIFYGLMAISAVFELKMLALGIGIGYYANDKQITLSEVNRSKRTFTTADLMSNPRAKVISLIVTVFAYVIFNMSVMAFCFGFFTACYYTYKANAQIHESQEQELQPIQPKDTPGVQASAASSMSTSIT